MPAKVLCSASTRAQGRVLYIVSEDWYFLSHRLPMARAAFAAGFEIHVATRVRRGAERIRAEGFVLHPVRFARGRMSPLGSLSTVRSLRRIIATVRPSIIHNVSLQPTVLGLLAASGCAAPCVNSLTGLGYFFTSESRQGRLARRMTGVFLRHLLTGRRNTNLVQNPDDMALLVRFGIPRSQMALIRGSGVDVERFVPLPEPGSPPTIAFVGRLLDDKGIRTLMAAQRLLRTHGPETRLLIAGSPDPANPSSVSLAEVQAWSAEPGVTWLGHVEDVREVWAHAHIAVLPSRREGLPLSLLEAAACGRPMIAADVPGCREIVIDGETGRLVPADNPAALAEAIAALVKAPQLRLQYGRAARERAVREFAASFIERQTAELYSRLRSLR